MNYALSDSVYLIHGCARSCIYDLNASRLYSINKRLAERIEEIVAGNSAVLDSEKELQKIMDEFLRLGIMEAVDSPRKNDIHEIQSQNDSCQFAWIEVTNKCNLKCIHCYNESEASCENTMSLEHYKMAVDSLVKAKIRKIQLIGGEPFFNASLLREMLDYTVGKFEFIEVFTNGTIIEDAWYPYLSKHRIRIALSVYSYDADMHDRVTKGKGSFAKTNRTIEKLKEYGIDYRVCNVLMKGIELGEQNTPLYTLRTDKDIVRMSGRASFALLSDALIRKQLITKETFQNPIKKDFCTRLVSGHNCFKDKIYISANLEVFPCVMERRLKHGTIDSTCTIDFDESIRHFNKEKIKECSVCEYRYACFDCRPNTLTGDILEKPWYCTYDPVLGKWMDASQFIAQLKETWGNTAEEDV